MEPSPLTPEGVWALRIGVVLSFTGLLLVLYAIWRRIRADSSGVAAEVGIAGGALLLIGLGTIAAIR